MLSTSNFWFSYTPPKALTCFIEFILVIGILRLVRFWNTGDFRQKSHVVRHEWDHQSSCMQGSEVGADTNSKDLIETLAIPYVILYKVAFFKASPGILAVRNHLLALACGISGTCLPVGSLPCSLCVVNQARAMSVGMGGVRTLRSASYPASWWCVAFGEAARDGV